jgi:hypothetical protein
MLDVRSENREVRDEIEETTPVSRSKETVAVGEEIPTPQFDTSFTIKALKIAEPKSYPRVDELIKLGTPRGWYLGLENKITELDDKQFDEFKKWVDDEQSVMSHLMLKQKLLSIKLGCQVT